jgi:hypothetical protein
MSVEQNNECEPKSQRRRFGQGLFKTRSNNRISPSPVTSPTPLTSSGDRKKLFSFDKPLACATTAGAGGFRMASTRSNSVTDYIEEIKERRTKKENKYDEENAILEQMRKDQAEDSQFSLNPLVCNQNDSESIFE